MMRPLVCGHATVCTSIVHDPPRRDALGRDALFCASLSKFLDLHASRFVASVLAPVACDVEPVAGCLPTTKAGVEMDRCTRLYEFPGGAWRGSEPPAIGQARTAKSA